MKQFLLPIFFLAGVFFANAQLTPEITSWIINTSGTTGYNYIPSNVQQVQYSDSNVYVSCTCIPGYDVGPWAGNPNVPSNQNFVFKITRFPQQNTGTLVETPLGHIGTWSNGVSIYNSKDGMSYNNQGIWNQNAILAEGSSFDSCLGHPAPNGEYHHHLNPLCLYNEQDSSIHSPIIGFAFDGFPIYGAYSFANGNGTGGITRMKGSYRERNISDRTTLPDGTMLNSSEYGPAISGQFPIGFYLEDFEFVSGLGDLDEHNGRFCVTPDYPNGIYAYFVTLHADLSASFPYTLGPEYYGLVQPGNTGPMSGHNIPNESVTTYNPNGIFNQWNQISFSIFPNPVHHMLTFFVESGSRNNLQAILFNELGKKLLMKENIQPTRTYSIIVSEFPAGNYFLKLESAEISSVKKVIIAE